MGDGGEHVVSLFFTDIARIEPVKVCYSMLLSIFNYGHDTHYPSLSPQILILKTCRMYNVFGSGANHAIYAQFLAQSAMANRVARWDFSEVLEHEWLCGSMQ
jgi:hypothetical protein